MDSNFLTQKVGPLPMVVWIGAGAVGLYISHRAAASNAASASGSAVDSPTAGNGPSGTGPGGWLPQQPSTDASGSSAATTPAAPQDNNAWGSGALQWLLSHNYDPTLSDSAVRNYLGSLPLSTNQQALISTLLTGYGAPPEILSPTGQTPTPVTPVTPAQPPPLPKPPTQASPPPKVVPPPPVRKPPTPIVHVSRTYTVRPGDNLTKIAEMFYHNANWQTIYNANRTKIANPNLIFPGQVLVIP